MTREEAIQILSTRDAHGALCGYTSGVIEALDMAIEALSADRPHGEWIEEGEYAECSMCGAYSGTQFDGVEPIPLKTNFCPNCGVRMKGGNK